MLRVLTIAVGLLATLPAVVASVVAEPAITRKASQPAPYMRVFGSALPPFGFVDFCERVPSECAPNQGHEARFEAIAR